MKYACLGGAIGFVAMALAGCGGDGGAAAAPVPNPAIEQPSETHIFSDEQVQQLMAQVAQFDETKARAAIDQIAESGDGRMAIVLIEMMIAEGFPRPEGAPHRMGFVPWANALEELTGKLYGTDAFVWLKWHGEAKLELPPGYVAWKGRLYARIDERFAQFFEPDRTWRIRPEEVRWGGVVVDGIAPVESPKMISPGEADYLEPDEPVFGLVVNGDVRAYPQRILDAHEMCNDVIGGVPVSLAYCTLCGAGIAFDRRVKGRDEPFDFSSSGMLYRSNKLMYDRQTRTLWNHLTGKPVAGPLADNDIELTILPSVVARWEDWLRDHPETRVMSLDTGLNPEYKLGEPYGQYFHSRSTMFPVWKRNRKLADKERIFGLRFGDVAKAYPLELLHERRVVNDAVGENPVVVIAMKGDIRVKPKVRFRGVKLTYSAGGEVRAYERGGHQFTAADAANALTDENGSAWRITEEHLVGPGDRQLKRLPGHLAYWFGWYAMMNDTELYESD